MSVPAPGMTVHFGPPPAAPGAPGAPAAPAAPGAPGAPAVALEQVPVSVVLAGGRLSKIDVTTDTQEKINRVYTEFKNLMIAHLRTNRLVKPGDVVKMNFTVNSGEVEYWVVRLGVEGERKYVNVVDKKIGKNKDIQQKVRDLQALTLTGPHRPMANCVHYKPGYHLGRGNDTSFMPKLSDDVNAKLHRNPVQFISDDMVKMWERQGKTKNSAVQGQRNDKSARAAKRIAAIALHKEEMELALKEEIEKLNKHRSSVKQSEKEEYDRQLKELEELLADYQNVDNNMLFSVLAHQEIDGKPGSFVDKKKPTSEEVFSRVEGRIKRYRQEVLGSSSLFGDPMTVGKRKKNRELTKEAEAIIKMKAIASLVTDKEFNRDDALLHHWIDECSQHFLEGENQQKSMGLLCTLVKQAQSKKVEALSPFGENKFSLLKDATSGTLKSKIEARYDAMDTKVKAAYKAMDDEHTAHNTAAARDGDAAHLKRLAAVCQKHLPKKK